MKEEKEKKNQELTHYGFQIDDKHNWQKRLWKFGHRAPQQLEVNSVASKLNKLILIQKKKKKKTQNHKYIYATPLSLSYLACLAGVDISTNWLRRKKRRDQCKQSSARQGQAKQRQKRAWTKNQATMQRTLAREYDNGENKIN
jgi:hypothetical protein